MGFPACRRSTLGSVLVKLMMSTILAHIGSSTAGLPSRASEAAQGRQTYKH